MTENVIHNCEPIKSSVKDVAFSDAEENHRTDYASLYNIIDCSNQVCSVPAWIWHDPFIFDSGVKAQFKNLSCEKRQEVIERQTKIFYAMRPAFYTFMEEAYSDPLMLLYFFKSLSLMDFKNVGIDEAETRYEIMRKRIKCAEAVIKKGSIDTGRLCSIWPILSIRNIFLESELANLFYKKNPPRKLAELQGAITNFSNRLVDISDKDYSGWLDEEQNEYAYLAYGGDDFWKSIDDDEEGNLNAKSMKALKFGISMKERPLEDRRINKELIRTLLPLVTASQNGNVTIYLPGFIAALRDRYSIDLGEKTDSEEPGTSRKRRPSITSSLKQLDKWIGVLDGRDIQRVLVITGFNVEAKTIDIQCPYLAKVWRRCQEKSEIEALEQGRKYSRKIADDHFFSSVAVERDKVAVDLAYAIVNMILQRGNKPLKKKAGSNVISGPAEGSEDPEGRKVTCRKKFRSFLRDVPQLRYEYENADSKYQYDILKRRFKAAYRIIREDTDLFDYLRDLRIQETLPTKRTIDQNLVITHSGRNPNYERKG